MKLLGNRALIQILEPEKTFGKIVLPHNLRELPVLRARVVQIGNGKRIRKTGERLPIDVKAGDIVLVEQVGGINLKNGLRIVSCLDLLARVDDGNVSAVEAASVNYDVAPRPTDIQLPKK